MDESVTRALSTQTRTRRPVWYGLAVATLLGLIVVFFAYRAWTVRQATTTAVDSVERLSARELQDRYGLRVRLIGVTAGGGMIDFRLKVLDSEKAREFLQDPANLPRLIVAESGTALMGTQELGDDVKWEDGGILFILFSNSGGIIQPGTPVIVEFGDVQLEPILAQ